MTKKILLEGMTCENCVRHVKEALSELEGVKEVNVTLEDKAAIITANDDIEDDEIKFVIDEVGYEVAGIIEI